MSSVTASSSSASVSATVTTSGRSTTLYGGKATRRVTVRDIAAAKERGEKWPMVTAYDAMTARVFDEAGIPASPPTCLPNGA